MKRYPKEKFAFIVMLVFAIIQLTSLTVYADDEYEKMPREYEDFIDSLPEGVTDKLSDGVYSDDPETVSDAAAELSAPQNILTALIKILGERLTANLPRLALILGIITVSAVLYTFSSSFGSGLGKAVDFCARLCTYCALAGISVSSLSRLTDFFSSLFSSVAAFLPLSATLYAMGGNFTVAASSSASLSVILTVCQFICSYTVIPIFCICLCLSLLSAFDGVFPSAGASVSEVLKKWYTTALGFIMMILTTTLATQSIISAKADSMAMRGAKFMVNSFVPISGGSVSSTLGTLAASIEMIRGSVGVIGIVAILFMLLPTVIELAIMRFIYGIAEFAAGLLSCSQEKKLISEIGGLYGYLEGVAVLCSVIFIIAFAMFASLATPF